MRYLNDKSIFVGVWLSALGRTADQNDRKLAEAVADVLELAYEAGVAEGKRIASGGVILALPLLHCREVVAA